MKLVPADNSLIYKGNSMPDISLLSKDHEKEIETKILGDSIETLKERWPFLNESSQKKIIQLVH